MRTGILLRGLLIVALIFNGATGAWASAQMLAAPAPPPEATPAAESSHGGCHESPATPVPVPDDSTPSGHADCCGVGLCGCACAQLPSLSGSAALRVPENPAHEPIGSAVVVAHDSAPVPHLTRPPIG